MAWFNFDPCGMICAAITHLLLVYAQYVVTYIILLPWFEMSVQGMLHQICKPDHQSPSHIQPLPCEKTLSRALVCWQASPH